MAGDRLEMMIGCPRTIENLAIEKLTMKNLAIGKLVMRNLKGPGSSIQ